MKIVLYWAKPHPDYGCIKVTILGVTKHKKTTIGCFLENIIKVKRSKIRSRALLYKGRNLARDISIKRYWKTYFRKKMYYDYAPWGYCRYNKNYKKHPIA